MIRFSTISLIAVLVVGFSATKAQGLAAVDDRVTVFKNEPIIISNYKDNDIFDPSCAAEESRIQTHPKHGTATISFTDIIYTPEKDFIGRDSLQYILRCNGDRVFGWIFITVAEMPDNIDTTTCVVAPDPDVWTFQKLNQSTQVYSAHLSTLVGDVDSDGIVEVLAVENVDVSKHFYFLDPTQSGMPVKYSFTVCDGGSFAQHNCVSFADVDKDGYAEVFYTTQQGYLYCIEYDIATNQYKTTYRWKKPYTSRNSWYKCPQPMFADFNGDGVPEVMVYDRIYNAVTGDLIVDGNFNANNWNCGLGAMHRAYTSPYSAPSLMAIGDLDGDGLPEIAAGNMAYKVNIVSTTDPSLNSITLMMQSENFSNVGDGATALVDLDLDGFLDVVVIRRNGGTPGYGASTASLFVWNPRTGQMLHTNAISNFPTSTGSGGPGIPLIADMDGDGVPEIGISACNVLRTYKYNKATRTLNQMWSLSTTDGSASTGITLFDFNLDGKSELVYRDQTHLRILDGTTGKDLTKIANSSCTFSEYPVVADVNNDGAAEIIVSGWPSGNCEWRGYICVFSSNPSGRWAPARKVWNQFGYNTVNINEDLTVPRYQFPPASTLTDPSTGITRRPYNCFLQQATVFDRYGVSIHPAAEVFATDIKTVSYDGDSVVVTIKMVNNGSIPLTSPFKITLYKDSSQTEVVYTATIYEEIPVAPEGKTIRFSMPNPKEHLPCEAWVYSINDAGKGIGHKAGLFAECDTTNNKTICHPLVANNDFSTIWKNTQAEILPLTNDVYFCRDIKPEILSSTKHGSFVYNTTTKSYIYTPDLDFWGLDTVKYRLICGKDTAYALIVMTVSEMPDNIIRSSCVLDPDATPWSIKTGHTSTIDVHAYAQALCGDIDGDGRNEIVTVGMDGGTHHSSSTIIILDENLATKKTFTVPTMNVYGGYPVVIADADRDGVGEIYVHCGDGYLYCYDANGNQQWKSDATVLNGARSAVLAIADINNDNVPDILALDGVFNALTGVKEVSLPNIPGASSPYNGVSAMPVMADMDNDGALEVVGGNEVIKVNIVDANNATANTASIWKQWNDGTAAGTGFTSVADIDLDGYLDVVVVRGGLMYAWKPYTGAGSSPVLIGSASSGGSTGGSAGSRALVADIDADGYPEIAWTYANSVQAYEYNPNNKNLVQKWKKSTSDGSGATTMSVFDFNQDGAAEIVYRDETYLRIMDGINGNNITTFSCSSGTAVEYPIIVDLDRDGAAEIVISGNGKMNSFVSKDEQVWAPARYVWNQHGYNVVHVNNDLTIPKMQFNPSTKLAGADGIENTADDVRPYNTFLQQATQLDTTGTPMFLVSDLYADNISTVTHAAQQMTVSLDMHNQGMATAQKPIYIAVYSDSSRQHLLTIDTLKQSIDMNKSLTHSFTINKVDSLIAYNEGLVFDINSRGRGIAHADKLTAECDTMNNRINRPATIAIPDSLIVCLKTPAVIIQPLDNDIVDANTTPTLSITARPTKGNASVQGTEIAYTLGKFEGVDSLDYRVVAGADTAFARIYIIESEKVAVAEDIEAEDVFICLNTTAHLAARSHLTGPTFNWYSDSTLKNQLATGETFITPVLNKEVSYWVTVQNADTCENKPLTGKRVNIGFYPNKETQLVDSVCVGATYTKYNFNIYKQNKAGVFTYTQQQQTENGCDSIIKLSLKVIPNPVLDLGEDTVICSGRDHAFVLTAPAGFDGYMWEDYSTQRSRTITEDGTYTLRVRKGICFDTKSKKVEFHEFSFTLGGNRTVCRNDEFLLEPSQGGRTYLWSNGSNASTVFTTETGTYWLEIVDAKGCSYSDTVVVTPVDYPTLELRGGEHFCDMGRNESDSLFLTTDAEFFGWENGRENEAGLFITEHGTYKAWAENETGCRTEAEITIDECPCTVYMNNAFSPNGDGLNETIYPITTANTLLVKLSVYNRWGTLIYEAQSTDLEAYSEGPHWDGKTSNGEKCSPGVYLCRINYVCKDNGDKEHTKNISVTVIR